jgi:hypothetical protein
MRLIFAALSFFLTTSALAQSAPATQPATDQAALERQFEAMLNNATLVGRFTADGAEGTPREDRYSLGTVKHVAGDMWVITAKIGRGQQAFPLPIPVKWAGDTPVISVTNFGIPGMGSYTARVVFYNDHYAGFWSAGPDHQGTMYGRVERAPATQPASDGK